MINISWRWICANVSDWIEAVTSLLIYHLVSVCAHKKRKEQLFYCFLSPNRGVTFVLRESTRQIERLLSFLFSSWLLVVLQQRVGRRMWQEPLGWEMTVKSGPTFRARTEESLNNHMHSNTTHTHTHSAGYVHMYACSTKRRFTNILTVLQLVWKQPSPHQQRAYSGSNN